MKLSHATLALAVLSSTTTQLQAEESNTLARWDFDSIHVTSDGKEYFHDASGYDNDLFIAYRNGENILTDSPDGKGLKLERKELMVKFNSALPHANMSGAWEIETSIKTYLTGTEQAFICKEGERGMLNADLSIGYDNSQRRYYLEVADADGQPQRVLSAEPAKPGQWYELIARGEYLGNGSSIISLSTAEAGSTARGAATVTKKIKGYAMKRRAGQWVIGRGYPSGYPNSLTVLGGAIDNLSIKGRPLEHVPGANPIFGDRFTADPAVMAHDGTAYAYVGEDQARRGGWFTMPHWLCYSSTDMKHWTAHGPVLKAADFPNANPNGAWAAQVVERDGKFYFYVTLDNRHNGEHMIDVAVGDSPLGPFKPARNDGTPLITDNMTPDSHRPNADIDPTVFVDDDGTAWMAWGNGDFYLARLKDNMIELDGDVVRIPTRNTAEGPWLFKRNGIYYNVYAADAPGVQAEQIAYSTATTPLGPWEYRGLLTGSAKHGFTIHPSVVEFNGKWYFFYHDGTYDLNGEPGGDCRRQVCVEPLFFNPDGTIQPIKLTTEGISKY